MCLSQMLCCPAEVVAYATYLPSGEIAACDTFPLVVSLVTFIFSKVLLGLPGPTRLYSAHAATAMMRINAAEVSAAAFLCRMMRVMRYSALDIVGEFATCPVSEPGSGPVSAICMREVDFAGPALGPASGDVSRFSKSSRCFSLFRSASNSAAV